MDSKKNDLQKQLNKEKKNINDHDGFDLVHFASQAFDHLNDLDLAKYFIEEAEKKIGTEDQAHPCDLGKYLYLLFNDKNRAQTAYQRSLEASGWDSHTIKVTEKDWLKIIKSFK
jgi:hypothetical protein